MSACRKIAYGGCNPYIDIDNFAVTYITTTTSTSIVPIAIGSVWDKAYRYGFNGKDKDIGIDDYDFGARIYDGRIGRWLSLDPLMGKYPNQSPYDFCFNNPLSFIDIDGRDVSPNPKFSKSPYGAIYNNLRSKNSVFNKTLSKYISSNKFNFTLNYSDKGLTPSNFASTSGEYAPDLSAINLVSNYSIRKLTKTKEELADGKTVIVTYIQTEIAKASTIIHEAIHAKIFTETIKKDPNHNLFAKSQPLLLKGLIEYNRENKLGYSNDELTQLSWVGLEKSNQFKKYITNLSEKNKTTYNEEYSKYKTSTEKIMYKETKREDKVAPPSETKPAEPTFPSDTTTKR